MVTAYPNVKSFVSRKRKSSVENQSDSDCADPFNFNFDNDTSDEFYSDASVEEIQESTTIETDESLKSAVKKTTKKSTVSGDSKTKAEPKITKNSLTVRMRSLLKDLEKFGGSGLISGTFGCESFTFVGGKEAKIVVKDLASESGVDLKSSFKIAEMKVINESIRQERYDYYMKK